MKINNYYWIILVGLFLCIVNCVQAGGNETGLLPGMSKTSFEKILKRTSENIKKKRASADAYSGGYPFSISGDIRSVPS